MVKYMGEKYQLFHKIPDKDYVNSLVKYYGLSGLDCGGYFSRDMMRELGTVEKMLEEVPTLLKYYLPCKARKFLVDISDKRAITILRQLLRPHGYKLRSKEKYKNGTKYLQYSLDNNNKMVQKRLVITFD